MFFFYIVRNISRKNTGEIYFLQKIKKWGFINLYGIHLEFPEKGIISAPGGYLIVL